MNGTLHDLYCRLSVAPDGSTETVERQERLMREELARTGDLVRHVYVDNGESASDPDVYRPDFERLFQRIAAGDKTPVMVWAWERYLRQPFDLERLVRAARSGLTIRSLYGNVDLDNSEQLVVARILTAIGAKESDTTRRRVKAAALERAQQGRPDQRSYGYLPGGTLVESEAAVLREAARRKLAGESWKSIVLDFTARGIRALPKEEIRDGRRRAVAPGAPFTHTSLRITLARPILGGIVELNGEPLGVLEEAVLDQDTFARLQALLASTRRGRPPSTKYLLTGYMFCTDCGGSQHGSTVKEPGARMPDGRPRRIYKCNPTEHEKRCSRTITAEYVEEIVAAHIKAALANPLYRAKLSLVGDGASAELDALHREAKRLGAGLADLIASHALQEIPEASYQRRRMQIRTRLATVRGLIEDASNPAQAAAAMAAVADAEWDSATPEVRRQLVEGLVRRVLVSPGKPGASRFDPRRVHVELVLSDVRPSALEGIGA